jgi:hypothetical protein
MLVAKIDRRVVHKQQLHRLQRVHVAREVQRAKHPTALFACHELISVGAQHEAAVEKHDIARADRRVHCLRLRPSCCHLGLIIPVHAHASERAPSGALG